MNDDIKLYIRNINNVIDILERKDESGYFLYYFYFVKIAKENFLNNANNNIVHNENYDYLKRFFDSIPIVCLHIKAWSLINDRDKLNNKKLINFLSIQKKEIADDLKNVLRGKIRDFINKVKHEYNSLNEIFLYYGNNIELVTNSFNKTCEILIKIYELLKTDKHNYLVETVKTEKNKLKKSKNISLENSSFFLINNNFILVYELLFLCDLLSSNFNNLSTLSEKEKVFYEFYFSTTVSLLTVFFLSTFFHGVTQSTTEETIECVNNSKLSKEERRLLIRCNKVRNTFIHLNKKINSKYLFNVFSLIKKYLCNNCREYFEHFIRQGLYNFNGSIETVQTRYNLSNKKYIKEISIYFGKIILNSHESTNYFINLSPGEKINIFSIL